jgi:hypothetical protein
MERELTQTDNAPLLFNSRPPGRNGRVTLFLRTRRTLRKRLGVHDLGQIEGVFQDRDREIGHDQMKNALSKMTQWRYLFPPEVKEPPEDMPVDCREFKSVVARTLQGLEEVS